jgi:hypothetical protein
MNSWEDINWFLYNLSQSIDGYEPTPIQGNDTADEFVANCRATEAKIRPAVDAVMALVARNQAIPPDVDAKLLEFCDMRLRYGCMLAHQFHWLELVIDVPAALILTPEMRLHYVLIDTWPSFGHTFFVDRMEQRVVGFRTGVKTVFDLAKRTKGT